MRSLIYLIEDPLEDMRASNAFSKPNLGSRKMSKDAFSISAAQPKEEILSKTIVDRQQRNPIMQTLNQEHEEKSFKNINETIESKPFGSSQLNARVIVKSNKIDDGKETKLINNSGPINYSEKKIESKKIDVEPQTLKNNKNTTKSDIGNSDDYNYDDDFEVTIFQNYLSIYRMKMTIMLNQSMWNHYSLRIQKKWRQKKKSEILQKTRK